MSTTTPCLPRRAFFATTGLGLLGAALPRLGAASAPGNATAAPSTTPTPWPEADAILARLQAPMLRTRVFSPVEFGLPRDDRRDARPALLAAIRLCNATGGGRIVVPPGVWRLDGPLHLTSGVHLHLSDGATLRFTPDPKLYLPPVLTRWEGTEVFNHSPCIYAYQANDVAITGRGTIDGSGGEICTEWRKQQRPDRDHLRELGAAGTPVFQRVFGDGHWLRYGLVQFFGCTRVLLEDFTAINSPFWCLHAVASQHLTVRRVRVEGAHLNNDCFDPESSSEVLVEDCVFHSGDDCIAIKSGRDQDGWRIGRPSENIVIRRCEFASTGAAAVAIGSEMSGGVRHVYVQDCRVGRTRYGLNFKGNLDRGGTVEHVRVRGVSVDTAVEQLIQFSYDYQGLRAGGYPPSFRDFVIEDITCREAAGTALNFSGAPGATLADIVLRRITAPTAKTPLTVQHAQNLTFEDVRINGALVPSPTT
jgi:polygalacturonase